MKVVLSRLLQGTFFYEEEDWFGKRNEIYNSVLSLHGDECPLSNKRAVTVW
jgi:hypothetical protein